MRIRYLSADVCSSDLLLQFCDSYGCAVCGARPSQKLFSSAVQRPGGWGRQVAYCRVNSRSGGHHCRNRPAFRPGVQIFVADAGLYLRHQMDSTINGHVYHHAARSEEHTSELQSLMRISYAVFCLKKKNKGRTNNT